MHSSCQFLSCITFITKQGRAKYCSAISHILSSHSSRLGLQTDTHTHTHTHTLAQNEIKEILYKSVNQIKLKNNCYQNFTFLLTLTFTNAIHRQRGNSLIEINYAVKVYHHKTMSEKSKNYTAMVVLQALVYLGAVSP